MGDIRIKQMNYQLVRSIRRHFPLIHKILHSIRNSGKFMQKLALWTTRITNFKKFVEMQPGNPLGYFSMGNDMN